MALDLLDQFPLGNISFIKGFRTITLVYLSLLEALIVPAAPRIAVLFFNSTCEWVVR